MLKRVKQPGMQRSRTCAAPFYRVVQEPSLPADIPGFPVYPSRHLALLLLHPLHFFRRGSQNVEKQEEEEGKKREKLAAGVCLMAAASPLENSQVACELFRKCGESAAR